MEPQMPPALARPPSRSRSMTWLRPWMVTALLASATLATAAFFVAGALSFAPEQRDAWGAMFRKRAILFGYAPFALWAMYMAARVRLSDALVARGEFEVALRYASARVVHNFWLRSRREVLIHRLAMGEAALATGDMLRADEALVFGDEVLPRSTRELLRLSWLRMELHLRMDNLLKAREAFERFERHRRPLSARVHQLAARVEVACRMQDEERARGWLEQAQWIDASHPRVVLSEALMLARFSKNDNDLHRSIELLDEAHDAATLAIPGRQAELFLIRAELHERLGDDEAMTRAVERAHALVDEGAADARAVRTWNDWQRDHAHPTDESVVSHDDDEQE